MGKRYRNKWLMIWPYFIFIGMSLFIIWFQYTSRAMILEGDTLFHVNQFYESAMQIKTGHYSWFMTMFGFGQSGRVINAFYGPIFSYLVGSMTLLVGTWFRTQMVLEFIVLTMSGLTMYYLGRVMHFNQVLSVSLGCIYATSFPIVSFIHNQMFDGIGNILLPLVIIMGIKMWHSGKIKILPLAILMATTFQIHVLTTVIAALALIPFALVSWIMSKHRLCWLIHLAISIGIFLLLTCNIWAGMLDISYRNYIIKPFPNFNVNRLSVMLTKDGVTLMNHALVGIVLLTLFLALITYLKSNWRQRLIFVLAIFYTFLSSAYFPWNTVIRHFPSVSQIVQFPNRFLGIAIIMILLTSGNSIELLRSEPWHFNSEIFTVAICLLMVGALGSVKLERDAFNHQVMQWNNRSFFTVNRPILQHLNIKFNRICKAFNKSRNLGLAPQDITKPIPDYLPSDRPSTPQNYFKIRPYLNTMKGLLQNNYVRNHVGHRYYTAYAKRNPRPYYFKKHVNSQGLVINWHQPKSLNQHAVILPLVKYHHTQVSMDHHSINPAINQVGLIKLFPRAGYHHVTIRYQAFPGFKLVLLVNLISWLLILAWIIKAIKGLKIR